MEAKHPLPLLPSLLLPWFSGNARDLPWRTEREPYHIWLSEIMLQQTRVEAVKRYYARFLEALPTVEALANASPDRLNKLWEGLGYYSRAKNLQRAAVQIQTQYGGVFPETYAEVRALPGIGDYTAGAICSICFGQPTPAVDGNVLRVLARLTEDPRPVTAEQTKKSIRGELASVYPARHCGEFTQALMELGAIVCLPNGSPLCTACPLRSVCLSHQHQSWQRFPVKAPKKKRRRETLTVFVLNCDGRYAVEKRADGGLLAGLWQFPNVPGHLAPAEAVTQAERWGVRPRDLLRQLERTHVFTHVEWEMRCYYLSCSAENEKFTWADRETLRRQIALPTAFRMFRDAEFNSITEETEHG